MDKQDKLPLFNSVVAGVIPRSLVVISGTHAEMIGAKVGKTYLAAINRSDGNREYVTHDGRQGTAKNWNMTILGELSNPVELLQAAEMLGDSKIENDVVIAENIPEAVTQA